MIKRNAACFLFAVLSHFLFCGGSSEQGNSFHITGQVTTTDGNRTCRLALVPDDFNPITDEDDNVIYTESDTAGNYTFEDVKTGEYYLNAIEPETKQRLLKGPIAVEENNLPFGTDTVMPTSYIIADIASDSSDTIVGIYIKGTTDYVSNLNNHSTLAIPSVPSGTVDIVSVVKTTESSDPVTRTYLENVVVNATDTVGVTYNNRPPFITSLPSQFVSNDENGDFYRDTILASDPEDDPLSYAIVSGPDSVTIDEKSGVISWQVPRNDTTIQTYAITVKVMDDKGAYTTATLTVVSEPSATITPLPKFIYGDSLLSRYQTLGEYRLEAFDCSAAPTQYRFIFNNKDTTIWSTAAQIRYTWDPDEYKNDVKAQMHCEDYSSPSEWTNSFYVWMQPDSLLVASPPSIEGPDTCVVGEMYSYLPLTDDCMDDSTRFIIVWDDGDTTYYTPDYSVDTTNMVAHTWKDTGTFVIIIAVAYSNYPVVSEYAKTIIVTVYKDSSMIPTTVKSLMPPDIMPENVAISDTIFIEADTTICSDALYQFFCNDSALSGRSTSPRALHVPDVPGLHQFTYAIWCEDSTDYCCYSEPANVLVSYLPDNCTLVLEIFTDSIYNDGGYAIETAVYRDNCQPSFSDCNYRYIVDYNYSEKAYIDTSDWVLPSDTTFIVPVESGGTITVSAQSRCGNEDVLMYESNWTTEKISFP